MGLLQMLFGGKNKYKITCPNCGFVGNMFTRGGAYNGEFEIVGKTENASLHINECPKCKKSLAYDSLTGKVSVYKVAFKEI